MVYFLIFLVPDDESLIWRKAARVYIPLKMKLWVVPENN
jgi:hypothetical protein